jgi:hypothetical protein
MTGDDIVAEITCAAVERAELDKGGADVVVVTLAAAIGQ